MEGRRVLELVYDICAGNEVSDEDRRELTEAMEYIDYDHHKIVIGGNDLRIYDSEGDCDGDGVGCAFEHGRRAT